ncbi:NAD(P)-binding protein [Patellaria atrata CBS 101060]|uniref:NAD(P)-binding protein n=1 Tax=Patellaria atrata CBS 101060 TaxID=1346257 RepID=A0A9P4VLF4_9PEZI|nr:NAD(P)-binding protein [Patellaria atrata CBS 101060]
MSKYTNTVLITGGTINLGYHCALNIAKQRPDWQVVIASRTDPNSAAATINRTLGQDNVLFMRLDLASLTNVRAFVGEWKKKSFPPIQVLLLNAGLQFPNEVLFSEDGIEKSLAITHVGHALLFHLLVKHLTKNARIIVTSSGTHDPAQKSGMPHPNWTTAEAVAHPPKDEELEGEGRTRYTRSKLANVLWMYALDRRISSGRTVAAFDPGLMPGSGLAREYSPLFRFLWNHIMPAMLPLIRLVFGSSNVLTPAASAANLTKVALDPYLDGVSGVYYSEGKQIKTSVESYDEEKQEDLWRWTVENIAKSIEEKERFNKLE